MSDRADPGQFAPESFEELFDRAPCGYLVLGADGRISRVNLTLCHWTGYSRADFIGKRIHQFLNIAGRIYYETHISPLLRMQGFFHEFALDLTTAGAQRLPVIANAVEQRTAEGGLLSTRFAMLKAIDRRRYERELVDARASASQLLQSERDIAKLREQFIAVLGHDLRNPLAAISAGARLLQRSDALREGPELRVLDMMNATVARMSTLIDNILDFARGRLGGGIPISSQLTHSLDQALKQIVDELRAALPARVIESDIYVTQPVVCDRARIGQMVSNLLGNALTHGVPDRPVRVGARTTEGILELWVSNSGEPIPDAAIPRLFEPFFRGDAVDSRQGLGLGLYIVSQIAAAHGGKVAVSSTREETRFTFTMPLEPADAVRL